MPRYSPASLRLGALAASFLLLPALHGQSMPAPLTTELPDSPGTVAERTRLELAELSTREFPEQQSTPPQPGNSPPATPDQQPSGEEQLHKQEHQRVFGVIPAFNSVNGGVVPPLTPRQKFQLMFKSTTDPYVFAFSAVTAGIGQAQNSHAGYGQGVEGYAKRFGASYADTADGNFWGNAVLPIVLHEDPRYYRLGQGTFIHRLLYTMSTTIICRRDDGTKGPNYANILGNLIAGGISNIYYPSEDRGAGQTIQNAATVTAEGMIGAALIEFWPDIQNHYRRKKQAKLEAAAAQSARDANPQGEPKR